MDPLWKYKNSIKFWEMMFSSKVELTKLQKGLIIGWTSFMILLPFVIWLIVE